MDTPPRRYTLLAVRNTILSGPHTRDDEETVVGEALFGLHQGELSPGEGIR